MSLRRARHLAPTPPSGGTEPVLVAARVTQVLTTAAPLLVLILGAAGLATAEETTSVVDATVTAIGAIGTVAGLVVPIVQARRAREQVVPAERVLAYREKNGHVIAGPASSTPTGTFVTVRRADADGPAHPLDGGPSTA